MSLQNVLTSLLFSIILPLALAFPFYWKYRQQLSSGVFPTRFPLESWGCILGYLTGHLLISRSWDFPPILLENWFFFFAIFYLLLTLPPRLEHSRPGFFWFLSRLWTALLFGLILSRIMPSSRWDWLNYAIILIASLLALTLFYYGWAGLFADTRLSLLHWAILLTALCPTALLAGSGKMAQYLLTLGALVGGLFLFSLCTARFILHLSTIYFLTALTFGLTLYTFYYAEGMHWGSLLAFWSVPLVLIALRRAKAPPPVALATNTLLCALGVGLTWQNLP